MIILAKNPNSGKTRMIRSKKRKTKTIDVHKNFYGDNAWWIYNNDIIVKKLDNSYSRFIKSIRKNKEIIEKK